MVWSLSAELGATEMAVAHRIADIVDGPDGRDVAGCIDVSYWDIATIHEIDAVQRKSTNGAPLKAMRCTQPGPD